MEATPARSAPAEGAHDLVKGSDWSGGAVGTVFVVLHDQDWRGAGVARGPCRGRGESADEAACDGSGGAPHLRRVLIDEAVAIGGSGTTATGSSRAQSAIDRRAANCAGAPDRIMGAVGRVRPS